MQPSASRSGTFQEAGQIVRGLNESSTWPESILLEIRADAMHPSITEHDSNEVAESFPIRPKLLSKSQ